MPLIPDEIRGRIVAALAAKGANEPCPRCRSKAFGLVDGYIGTVLLGNPSKLELQGTVLPSIAVICNNCGWIAHHALGPLGLMELATRAQTSGEQK